MQTKWKKMCVCVSGGGLPVWVSRHTICKPHYCLWTTGDPPPSTPVTRRGFRMQVLILYIGVNSVSTHRVIVSGKRLCLSCLSMLANPWGQRSRADSATQEKLLFLLSRLDGAHPDKITHRFLKLLSQTSRVFKPAPQAKINRVK